MVATIGARLSTFQARAETSIDVRRTRQPAQGSGAKVRRVQARKGQVQLCLGRSLTRSSPWRRQPIDASQVRGFQVGVGSSGRGGGVRKPSNQGADEQG